MYAGFVRDYIKIARHYGLDFQQLKLAEECAEYAAATLKSIGYQMLMSKADTERNRKHFLEKWTASKAEANKELADVLVLAHQINWLLDHEASMEFRERIEKNMEDKVRRQIYRIEEEKANAR